MKSNQEILDEFGKIIVENIVDRYYKLTEKIIFNGSINPKKEKYNTLFKSLKEQEKLILKEFIIKNYNSIIFDFLNVFEENSDYKLYYQKDDKKIDLVEISEMLKSELIIENGWIDRFSKAVKNDEKF